MNHRSGYVLQANQVEAAIKEAEAACADGTAGQCAAAWDSVSQLNTDSFGQGNVSFAMAG